MRLRFGDAGDRETAGAVPSTITAMMRGETKASGASR